MDRIYPPALDSQIQSDSDSAVREEINNAVFRLFSAVTTLTVLMKLNCPGSFLDELVPLVPPRLHLLVEIQSLVA